MKEHRKNIVILGFSIILSIEFYIYFSEYDVSTYLILPIAIATSLLSLLLINNNVQNKKLKVFFLSVIILFTILFFLGEAILAILKSANEVSQTWTINKFEIQAVRRSFDGPEPSFYTLKEVYCFGLIHKEMDISFPKNFKKIGNKCILEFVDVNLAYDLCNLKQEK